MVCVRVTIMSAACKDYMRKQKPAAKLEAGDVAVPLRLEQGRRRRSVAAGVLPGEVGTSLAKCDRTLRARPDRRETNATGC